MYSTLAWTKALLALGTGCGEGVGFPKDLVILHPVDPGLSLEDTSQLQEIWGHGYERR